jgi:hypothetical protein
MIADYRDCLVAMLRYEGALEGDELLPETRYYGGHIGIAIELLIRDGVIVRTRRSIGGFRRTRYEVAK